MLSPPLGWPKDEDDDCQYFTYYTSTGICIAFSECPSVTDDNCDDCATGQVGCELVYVCSVEGACTGSTFADTLATETEDECLQVLS